MDHFNHPYSLFLHNSILISGYANCYSCCEQLSTSSQVFNCSDCDFYLHKLCSLDLIEHYRDYKHILNSFNNHPLEIIYYDREVPGVVCCTLCHKCCFRPTRLLPVQLLPASVLSRAPGKKYNQSKFLP